MISASEALDRLQRGNRRFVADACVRSQLTDDQRRAELVGGQAPFAVVLGCSDSRVPAEIVFDQGLGDLFVIRVAGHVAAPSQIGSVEFAVEQLGTRLVVVLGHSGCGAVRATMDELLRPAGPPSPNLQVLVDRIRPAVESVVADAPAATTDDLLDRAVRANVRHAVAALRHGSESLARRLAAGEILLVGAEYSLATGRVDFLDGGSG